MLIYVNNFELQGRNATDRALQSICGWVKYKAKENFTIEMLKSGGNYTFESIKVRTFCAVSLSPYMYSVLLTHPDHEINGRFWETEIGVTENRGITKLSILLKVNDISTQVRGNVTTTRPLLVKYLHDSKLLARNTVGLKTNFLNDDINDIKALKCEIYRPEREYPIVLVSKNKLVYAPKLQEQLIGLAQVVVLPSSMDDGLVESELGQRYSAWDGAINIINPLHGGETPRNKLILSDFIDSWKANNIHILHELLSLVTHTTNGKYRKEHFSPTDVRAKRQKDHRIALINKVENLADDSDYKLLLQEAMDELEIQQETSSAELETLRVNLTDTESMFYEAESDKADLENKAMLLEAKVSYLEGRLDGKSTGIPVLMKNKEVDLYEGEIQGILIDIIKPAFDSAKQYSRKSHVLKDILDSNTQSNIKTQMFEDLKIELKDYRSLTPKLREILASANIEILTDGSHNKAKFIGDERYSVTFAKTASDAHAGRNNLSTIKDNLF
ncbi:hypothetical protein [Aliivibrio fischeri]|uniref:Uncharacterized protein n=1 Tax=Aliivibrio fischeri TaxID=668 RepID=A0A844P832_ALIFS|nr:hypothetical protein [Aliivibrio fischeri]MUK51490.1 hypothetical protein [Aliivibrio fischeri]